MHALKYLFIILWQALRFIWLMHAARAEPIIHGCIVPATRDWQLCVCRVFVCVCCVCCVCCCAVHAYVSCKAAFCLPRVFVYLCIRETTHSIMVSHSALPCRISPASIHVVLVYRRASVHDTIHCLSLVATTPTKLLKELFGKQLEEYLKVFKFLL